MTRWLRHPLFGPVLALAALGWGTLVAVFLVVGPDLGGWATRVLTLCFGWSEVTRAYRLDAVLLVTLEPPLFALVVAFFYGDELRAFLRRRGGRVIAGAVAAGFVASAGALVGSGTIIGSQPSTAVAAPVREGRPAPRLRLTDHRGQPFDSAALAGRPVALTFVYASCHGACPAILAALQAVEARVGGRALFVAVTLDPERDTPSALAAHAERWSLGDAWRLVTGPPDVVHGARRAYGVQAARQPDGEIAHENVVVLIDRAGRIAYTYRGLPPAPEAIAAALTRLATEPS